jgi:hypothetical protein
LLPIFAILSASGTLEPTSYCRKRTIDEKILFFSCEAL